MHPYSISVFSEYWEYHSAGKTVIGSGNRDLPGMTSAATHTKFERTRPRGAFQSGAS
jgi:hypothetical protein